MIENLIGQLILVAGQWRQFQEQQYSDQFYVLLDQLSKAAGVTQEQAVELLLEHIMMDGVTA